MLGDIPTPVETLYAGHRFRSRLEARWAVFFDCLGLVWEYEPEGYALDEETWYLPDFLLPHFDGGLWCEVKHLGGDFSLAERFAVQQRVVVWACDGPPDYRYYRCLGTNWPGAGWMISMETGRLELTYPGREDGHMAWSQRRALDPIVQYAIDQAKRARFEHGEGHMRYRKPGGSL